MKKSVLIVEDNSDKFTFEAILRFIKVNEVEVNSTEVEISAEEILQNGIEWLAKSAENDLEKPTGLKDTIIGLFNDIKNGKVAKIGIVWDLDTHTVEERIKQFNNAFMMAKLEYIQNFSSERVDWQPFTQTNDFTTLTINSTKVEVACHCVNYEGTGEVENILQAIAAKPSLLADCVDKHLPECLKELGEKELRDKDLVKLWINHYQRYDTLKKKDRNANNTKWENIMLTRSDIFDFGKNLKELNELKTFLKMF